MKIIEKIKKILGITSPKKLAEEVIISFEERKQKGEKDPIDNTVKEAKRIINENPDIAREITKEILKEFIENEKIPESLFAKTAKEIALTPEIPDTVIAQAVQQTEKKVPGEIIEKIIEEGQVNPKERLELIQNVEEPEIVKRRVKNELRILYNNCKGKQDREIIDRILEIKSLLEKIDADEEIQDLVYEVISKKMAENYYDDKLKSTKIYEFSSVMPFEEMIEKGLPEKVEKQYQILEEKEGEKPDRFSKTKLTQLILDKMANDIAKKYDEMGILAIPQSDNMKKLNQDEEKGFIKAIQSFYDKPLSEENIMDIHEQIRGNIASNQVKQDILIEKIKKMPDNEKKKYMDLLIQITGDTDTLQTLHMMERLIETLNSMPEEKRAEIIKTTEKVIGQREQKYIATQTLKMPGNPKVDIYIEDNSNQR